VDSEHSAKGDGKVNFDVNNLKLQPPTAKNGEDLIAHKFANQGGPVPTIVQNARSRQLCVLKNPGEVSERIARQDERAGLENYRVFHWCRRLSQTSVPSPIGLFPI
jgi:hypothetical protein